MKLIDQLQAELYANPDKNAVALCGDITFMDLLRETKPEMHYTAAITEPRNYLQIGGHKVYTTSIQCTGCLIGPEAIMLNVLKGIHLALHKDIIDFMNNFQDE